MSLGLISVNDCAVNMLLRNEKMLKLAMMKMLTLTMLKVYMTATFGMILLIRKQKYLSFI